MTRVEKVTFKVSRITVILNIITTFTQERKICDYIYDLHFSCSYFNNLLSDDFISAEYKKQ